MKLTVLIELGVVPAGASVTKVTGYKPYVVQDEIVIHHDEKKKTTTFARQGTRFLLDGSNNVNAHPAGMRVAWETTLNELVKLFGEEEGCDCSR